MRLARLTCQTVLAIFGGLILIEGLALAVLAALLIVRHSDSDHGALSGLIAACILLALGGSCLKALTTVGDARWAEWFCLTLCLLLLCFGVDCVWDGWFNPNSKMIQGEEGWEAVLGIVFAVPALPGLVAAIVTLRRPLSAT